MITHGKKEGSGAFGSERVGSPAVRNPYPVPNTVRTRAVTIFFVRITVG